MIRAKGSWGVGWIPKAPESPSKQGKQSQCEIDVLLLERKRRDQISTLMHVGKLTANCVCDMFWIIRLSVLLGGHTETRG
jgi:hypothetical protein